MSKRARLIAWLVLGGAAVGWLLLYKLGSLTGGLSAGELSAANTPLGWHGIYHAPLDLPLKLVRSAVFYVFPDHGQTLTRLPNAIFGGLAIISFAWLMDLWHGRRTAILAGVLFATGAWTLHASRLASFEVLYLWATPTLLLTHVLINRYGNKGVVWYGSLLVWGMMIYIPGMVWLLLIELFLLRSAMLKASKHFGVLRSATYLLLALAGLSLLVWDLRRPGQLIHWLGAPQHLGTPLHTAKLLAAVPLHLFVRGPQYPDLWLSRVPILDIFTLAVCAVGIYFYLIHLKAARSRLLAAMALVGTVLVGLGGPVGLSLLVPLLYVGAAAGIAYLLREWLKVFPYNPLARGLGIGLVCVVIGLSSLYNLRAYFIAWPHNEVTRTVFRYPK